ncbi:MAG: SURF1 family protein [Anaerolineae bacterium]|nr:SURF1 family protein [Anaerolineae bacterium]
MNETIWGRWLRPLGSRRWRWVTFIVLLGVALLLRLGVWQLYRLQERRASNDLLAAQLAQPPLPLTGQEDPALLLAMADRQVAAAGQFDYDHQYLILLQPWEGQTGVYLVTPLLLDENSAILVNRGWLPQREAVNARQYDQANPALVEGVIQLSQVARYGSAAEPSQTFQPEQYRIEIELMQAQLPYTLLPVYIQQTPTGGEPTLPYRLPQEIDLSEGSHLSYALQWFSFAIMLAIGYVYYVQQQEKKGTREA